MYNPAAQILKVLTRDPVTFRTRDIRPGEEVRSIWDQVQRGPYRLIDPQIDPRKSTTWNATDQSQLNPSTFYGEPDVLEDEVLFPEELSTETSQTLYSGRNVILDDFIRNGPDLERFLEELDTDKAPDSDEDVDSKDDELTLEDESRENGSVENESDVNNHPFEHDHEMKDASEKDDDRSVDSKAYDGDGSRSAPTEEPTILDKLVDKLIKKIFSKKENEKLALKPNWMPPKGQIEKVQAEIAAFLKRERSAGWSPKVSYA